ncbi:hypothetical protein Tco_0194105, partial [Tanacetum coccineum]
IDFADMAQLLVRAQRHPLLRYEVLDFEGMTDEMSMDIGARLSMMHRDADGVVVFTSHAWRRLFDIRGSLVRELMLEFFNMCRFDDLVLDLDTEGEIDTDGFRRYWAESSRTVISKGDLRGYLEEISSFRDFLTTVPSYLLIRDPLRRLCHRLFAHTIAGRGQAPKKVTNTDLYFLRSIDQEMFDRHFIARITDHFGLLGEEKMHGLTVVGPERQQVVAADAPEGAEGPHVEEEALLEQEVHRIQVSLGVQREVVDTMAKDLSRFTMWVAGGIFQLLDLARVAYTRYFKTHVLYQRRVRPRADDASTSAPQQPDP